MGNDRKRLVSEAGPLRLTPTFMNRLQFWLLNLASAGLVLLLAGHFLLARRNNRIGEQLNREQTYIGRASQVSAVLDQMARRIALGSESDPRLRDVLIKYGLSVTLEAGGKKKTYP